MTRMQVDNASDNKNRWVLAMLGWLVLNDYVGSIELCMLMVGHTHEDIDQMFRVIAEALRNAKFIPTIGMLHLPRM